VFSFEYAALHYAVPGKNRYAYKMEGLEQEWNYAGNRRFATYAHTAPGEYVFRVKGSNNDGVWNDEGVSLKITIVPPFWRTLWFYALCALAVLLSALGIHRLRVRSLKKQEKKLTRLVKERTQELEKANRCKSDFLAMMSHEIRTPMNSIIGFTDLIMETPLSGRQVEFIHAIKQSGETLLDIINEILDLSRVEAGQLTLEPVVFDLKTMAFNVCELIIPRIADKPIEILCRFGAAVPPMVKGDGRCFRKVLINLMGNAVKFTEAGVVDLSIHMEEEQNHRLKLHTMVRDTGIGIPGDKQDLIFEAFQQVDISNTRGYDGTGLGLSISKQIAQLMGGDLWVKSETGKGSTFHFTAWVEKETDEKDREKAAKESMMTRPSIMEVTDKPPLRILMAEDNQLNRKLLGFMLNEAGYRLEMAVNGKEAVEKFCSDPDGFDLVLMDIQMPEMDGKDATRIIREKGFTRVPIIALTAASMKGDREKCVKAGMNDYISKPIKRDVLFETIKKWVKDKG
jgi:signal transduction histidine kinase/ActR/RegA family two-component response regulator